MAFIYLVHRFGLGRSLHPVRFAGVTDLHAWRGPCSQGPTPELESTFSPSCRALSPVLLAATLGHFLWYWAFWKEGLGSRWLSGDTRNL